MPQAAVMLALPAAISLIVVDAEVDVNEGAVHSSVISVPSEYLIVTFSPFILIGSCTLVQFQSQSEIKLVNSLILCFLFIHK